MKFLAVIGLLVVILGLSWAVQGNEFFISRWLAPQQERLRRDTFEQSKAYRDGMVKEVQAMMFKYVEAEPAHRDVLADLILSRVAGFDETAFPYDVRSFISNLRRERLGAK